jgi:hypothetical protein
MAARVAVARAHVVRDIFCASCEKVGLRWTQSNHRNISISHRHSVALLDEHVWPKS